MKSSLHDLCLPVSAFFILLLIILPSTTFGRHVHMQSDVHKSSLSNLDEELKSPATVEKDTISKGSISAKQHLTTKAHDKHESKGRVQQMLWIAGSSLPDCSHACGSCNPCRRVTVSFKCSVSTEESESCPMAYRCMCKGKSFPIP